MGEQRSNMSWFIYSPLSEFWKKFCETCLHSFLCHSSINGFDSVKVNYFTQERNSSDSRYFRRRGNCYVAMGFYDKALIDYCNMVQIEPDDERNNIVAIQILCNPENRNGNAGLEGVHILHLTRIRYCTSPSPYIIRVYFRLARTIYENLWDQHHSEFIKETWK